MIDWLVGWLIDWLFVNLVVDIDGTVLTDATAVSVNHSCSLQVVAGFGC